MKPSTAALSVAAALTAAPRARASPLPFAWRSFSSRKIDGIIRKVEPLPTPGGDEQHQEHREEAGEALDVDVVHDAQRRDAHRDEVPERHARAADLVGEQPAERPRHRADQRPEEGDGHRDRRETAS